MIFPIHAFQRIYIMFLCVRVFFFVYQKSRSEIRLANKNNEMQEEKSTETFTTNQNTFIEICHEI